MTPYCTLDQVKTALDLKKTSDDLWIQELIVEAQALLDRKIGYAFQVDGSLASPTTRYYDGNNLTQLFIDPCLQITQVREITNVPGPFPSSSTNDITADCYLAPNNISPGYLLKRLSGNIFLEGNRNYQVLGVFGFSEVPADITRACIRLTTHFYKMRDTNYNDSLIELSGVRQMYTKQIPPDVQEIIDEHRRTMFVCR